MKFTVREAILNTHAPDPRNIYTEGPILGIVIGAYPYEGAVEASRTIFKSAANPFRETGWPHEGGLFFTAKRSGAANDGIRVKDKPFFLRIGR